MVPRPGTLRVMDDLPAGVHAPDGEEPVLPGGSYVGRGEVPGGLEPHRLCQLGTNQGGNGGLVRLVVVPRLAEKLTQRVMTTPPDPVPRVHVVRPCYRCGLQDLQIGRESCREHVCQEVYI